MLKLVRLLLLALFFILSTVYLLIYMIVRPFRPNNVRRVAQCYGWFLPFLGVKVEIRGLENVPATPVVYVGNHQNTYDIFTVARAVQPNTVSIGKKSLKWMPFFGQVYWLSGNILIDRKNKNKAHGTIAQAAQKIKEKNISVWLFAEGTRSRGRGLLKFKTGAFHTAHMAGVPVVPVAISNTHELIDLNRWDNGKIIIEYLPAVAIEEENKAYIRRQADHVHDLMAAKIDELNTELSQVTKTSETKAG